MASRALVIGGTGPTGPSIVNGLIERGHDVTICHTGSHESELIPDSVTHIHTDPFDEDAAGPALAGQDWDIVVAMYGRLRVLARLLEGRTERLISIGGIGVYRGFAEPTDLSPTGMPVGVSEDALLADDESPRKVVRIRETEELVFELHPTATHLRYPMLYGPRQIVQREWPIVKRVLDGRSRLVLPDAGLTVKTMAYAENAAHAVLCAIDHPEAAGGQIYNVGDRTQLTLRQIVEVVADALGHTFEFVSMPAELAVPARPLLTHWWSGHRVQDLHRIRAELGYDDLVHPIEALSITARHIAEHPLDLTSRASRSLHDPFDYEAEDRLMDAWAEATASVAAVAENAFDRQPGYSAVYYGKRPNPGVSPGAGLTR